MEKPHCDLCDDGRRCGVGYLCPRCDRPGTSFFHWEAGKELVLSSDERTRREMMMGLPLAKCGLPKD